MEERLSHHLAAEDVGQTINEVIVRDAAARVHKDTFIIIDPTDIRKTVNAVLECIFFSRSEISLFFSSSLIRTDHFLSSSAV